MSVTRYRFNPLRESLLELSQLGSPVDLAVVPEDPHSCNLEIEQIGESRVIELSNGRSGYLLDILLTTQTSRPMYILDKELHLPWQENWVQWLEPHTGKARNPKERTDWEYQHYKFPGTPAWDLPFDEVLNHKLTSNHALPPYQPISGWLLAIGGFMPTHLFQGGEIEATLVITTSDHVEHSAPIIFHTERLERKPKRVGPRPSLFSDAVQEQKPKANNDLRVSARGPETINRKEIKVTRHNAPRS